MSNVSVAIVWGMMPMDVAVDVVEGVTIFFDSYGELDGIGYNGRFLDIYTWEERHQRPKWEEIDPPPPQTGFWIDLYTSVVEPEPGTWLFLHHEGHGEELQGLWLPEMEPVREHFVKGESCPTDPSEPSNYYLDVFQWYRNG